MSNLNKKNWFDIKQRNCGCTLTCSALRPGGHQAYSSKAQPESSSLFDKRECCWWSIFVFIEINWVSVQTLERTVNE